jgi:FkbM family methyltransferase
MSDFKIYNSDYGQFIVNQHCKFQGEALETTQKTHIEEELERMYQIVDSLPDNAVILDGGANIGFVTIPLTRRKPNAKIISIEAQKRLFYALAGTIAINDLYNVFLYNKALGNEHKVVSMGNINYGQVEDFGSMSIQGTVDSNVLSYISNADVEMVTIDSMNLEQLDFVKLDIEGYEPQALEGGIETIKRCRPWIWVEYHNCVDLYNQDIIKQVLSKVDNYSFHFITGDGQNMVCAPNEKLEKVSLPFLTSQWRGW